MLPRKLSKVGKAVLAILRAPPPKHACIGISLCIHAQVLLKLVDSQCMGTDCSAGEGTGGARSASCTVRLMMELALVVPEAERRDSRKSRRPHSIATIFRDSRVAPLCATFAVVDSST